MTTFRFIHCSDLHIDSPFKGFSAINPDWAERLRDAPLQSFLNIVDLAVDELDDQQAEEPQEQDNDERADKPCL